MTSSLVGSEMCIRDRLLKEFLDPQVTTVREACHSEVKVPLVLLQYNESVSYTHLTLPTICSV
eukprot:5234272-Prorocentrum_lima.AAC.1